MLAALFSVNICFVLNMTTRSMKHWDDLGEKCTVFARTGVIRYRAGLKCQYHFSDLLALTEAAFWE